MVFTAHPIESAEHHPAVIFGHEPDVFGGANELFGHWIGIPCFPLIVGDQYLNRNCPGASIYNGCYVCGDKETCALYGHTRLLVITWFQGQWSFYLGIAVVV
ncbi:hypothetical protein D3C75_944600 [compost metagenome]